MLDLVVIAEIAEIDSTIEMTTVIIIETTMVKIVLKVKKFFVKHENILKDPFTDYIGVFDIFESFCTFFVKGRLKKVISELNAWMNGFHLCILSPETLFNF